MARSEDVENVRLGEESSWLKCFQMNKNPGVQIMDQLTSAVRRISSSWRLSLEAVRGPARAA